MTSDSIIQRNETSRMTPRLEVVGLSTDNRVNDVSFVVKVGEVFGLGGMLGSGRTEIARAIYGIDRITRGQIKLDGKAVEFSLAGCRRSQAGSA